MWGHCSGSLNIGYWREKAKEKCDASVAIPNKECARLKFLSSIPRDEVLNFLYGPRT